MATTLSTVYGTPAAFTITLASLASDSTLIAGRQSTVLDFSGLSPVPVDAILGGFITTGTTPTAGQIEVWIAGSYDGTTFAGGVGATDANFSPTGEKTNMKLGTIIPTDATSNHQYEFNIGSVAALFGGVLPKKIAVFVVHNTVVVLNATGGNHEVKYLPINYQSA